ncbi:hypothetical protein ABL78_4739 [Leptomonas seymouri]|uniref:FCP1 homology domain-containing protein n=1 Tax=Leptomonas seymouri TaxID=5684 RepID=A0A0N0P590_LEPSE|nr:hypothetical protein ABL78_4739 [Leptomonas seymouri]|eukprot:KPI86186.1 hypothetical protein ABL78_4739 [Leptomonas seymouri]
MSSHETPASLDGGHANFMRRDRFEVNQYVRVKVSETRFAIGVVTAIDEDHDQATVETRNGYEVTLPISALRRAFLVVLDLNGVLVARGRGSFILRPHVTEFLRFVFSNFVVAVWTSGLQRSSNPIIEHVFGSYRDLLLFTLFRDACVPKATSENPYGTEKNLQTIFDRYPLSFHAVNTIIIDDSPDKCSHPDIALCPVPFKDPVAQSHDDGLLETMETLQQVLLLDSGAPLILAAEERLHRLEEQRQQQEQSGAAPPSVAAPGASPGNAEPLSPPLSHDAPVEMEEVELWKTRLCCDNLLGNCTRGAQCPFCHDPDDGRPCSRKSNCRYHSSRWPKTSEEAEFEAKKRRDREAKRQQSKAEPVRRQNEQRQQESSNSSSKGQSRWQADLIHQLQQSAPSSSLALQRQRGGGRHRQERQQQRRRGGKHEEELEEGDWASKSTGVSHTGDPTYDNMINEQQQQQRRRSAATAGRTSSTQGTYNLSVPHGRGVLSRSASSHATAGSAFNDSSYTNNSDNGNKDSSLNSGYRRLLQHHSQGSTSNSASANHRPDAYLQLHEQQQQCGQSNNAVESLPIFFQSAVTTTAATTTIEPFSTRPIALSASSAQQPSMAFLTVPHASPPVASFPQSCSFGTGGRYFGSHPQTIRISGSQVDSNAVVNQLQALMRKS